jgi:Superfamily II DNA helicase
MYHADTHDYNKERCLNSLKIENELPHVILATSALGCGINANNLHYVSHIGPSFSLVEYCQQIGRAGRDGNSECNAVLYYYPDNNRNVDKGMKNYCVADECH